MDKEKIIAGRKAVDNYREAHRQLYLKTWHRDIPEEHTILLNNLKGELQKQGFGDLDTFFFASKELNALEASKVYLRQGECNDCGKCCNGCKFYFDKIPHCPIYNTKAKRCEDYPTPIDFIKGLPKECSFFFVDTGYKTDIDLRWQ